MRRCRRFLACLWAAALVVSLALAGTASAEEAVYQMAVNDRFLEMNSGTMPFRSDGVLYIPYTIFDRNITGVRLGTSSFITRTDSDYVLTIYGVGNTLRFDMLRGICLNQSTGENTGMKAISRGGTYFVPVGVCSYFDLNVSLTPTSYGTLLRVTNGQQTYTIEKFIEVATDTGRLQERYNEYIRSQTAPGAVSTPSPTASGASPSPAQTPAGNEGPSRQDVPLYLAFQCTGGAGVDGILDTLGRENIRALFLFRPEDLAARDAQIRRIVGSGHMVGLLVSGGSGEEVSAAVEEGARLLERIARLRSHIVLLEEPPEEGTVEKLNSLGWTCWTGNVDGLPGGRSQTEQVSALLNAAKAQSGPVRITLDDSTASAGVLSRILPQLREAGYQFRLAVETQL